MKLSVVINTIAKAPDANRISSGGRPYADRLWLLRNVLLPWYHTMGLFRQVIVVGEFEEGPYHEYVPFEQTYHNVGDALKARDKGVEALTCGPNDWVLFQHDDHLWNPENPTLEGQTDVVLAPARLSRARACEATALNDGHEAGHINGHGLLMRLEVARVVPWGAVPPVHTWDVEYTKALRRADIPWRYAPEYSILDLEPFGNSWSDYLPDNYLLPAGDTDLELYRKGSTEPWTADVVAALARGLHASIVVETGTFEGRTTRRVWEALQSQDKFSALYSIEVDPKRAQTAHDALLRFIERTGGDLLCAVNIHNADALASLSAFPEGQVDLIFLDDDHSFAHVALEIEAALHALRPGGVLCLHDVCGMDNLGALVKARGGIILDFPRLHASGGLGVIVK